MKIFNRSGVLYIVEKLLKRAFNKKISELLVETITFLPDNLEIFFQIHLMIVVFFRLNLNQNPS